MSGTLGDTMQVTASGTRKTQPRNSDRWLHLRKTHFSLLPRTTGDFSEQLELAGDEFAESGFCADLSLDGLNGEGDHTLLPEQASLQIGAYRADHNRNESMRVVPYVSNLRCPLIDVPNGVVHYS